ncbi:MAG: FAD-dependent oxidoreductase, partial [Planctomycetota bacterium]
HITCRSGTVQARQLVLATHTPAGMHSVQTAIMPMLSSAIAVRIAEPLDDALYYDMHEPYRYIRLMDLPDGGSCLVIGGADRPVGSEEEGEAFAELRKFTRRHFTVLEELGHWSGMYFEPSDSLPFIGNFFGQERVWYATGFPGDGLTWAEIASEIIASAIDGSEHALAEVVKPQRVKAATTGKFMRQTMHAGKHFVLDRLPEFQHPAIETLAPGRGMVIGQSLRHVAVARLHDGSLHACSATCPHMGCRVHYNDSDRSFDCPCHGSRFALDGTVIEGPASDALEPIPASKLTRSMQGQK